MAGVIPPGTKQASGWKQKIAALVWWQRDLNPIRFWTILVCGIAFAGFGVRYLWHGIDALQQGKDWSSLIATGNYKMPYATIGHEIFSGSLILVCCVALLVGMIASRCGWLDRFVEP